MINPSDFVAWLTTQPNARGTLYLERVARHYVSFLRNTPMKLDVTLTIEERNIFACETIEKFEQLQRILTSAPNYTELNIKGHCSFSAGLQCYARYLAHIEGESNIENTKEDTTVMEIADKDLTELLDFKKHLENLIVMTSNSHEQREYEQLKLACDKQIAESQGKSTITLNVDIAAPKTENKLIQPSAFDNVRKPTLKLTEEGRTAIELLLETRYTNGFRVDSIEIGRLRRFALEYFNIELALSDEELVNIVKSYGTLFEGKIYIVAKETKCKIKQIAEDYFANGAKVIFYKEFYAKNENWLFEASIVSVEMLAGLLRQLFSGLRFTETYFGYTSENINTVLKTEIFRIWNDDVLLNYGQISERLQYIPIERIKFALGQNADFIWNSVEVFTHKGKIDTNDAERTFVREVAQSECSKYRYVSVTDLPLVEFTERNHELSQTAIQNAAYIVYLEDNYDKRGKIITKKGELINALMIMHEYCRSLDRVTLDELLDFEKDLTGENHRWIPMQAGYDVMVRIDENTYLAEHYFNFDVESIDNALEHFVHDEYTPLKTVTTFAVFPYCGQVWNLFLLESYVRRFSNRFRFDSPSVNNKNAGCIVRKYSNLDYNGIMIDAIAKSELSLNDESAVADFLVNNGYRGSRQKAKLADLIKQAKRLRERRN